MFWGWRGFWFWVQSVVVVLFGIVLQPCCRGVWGRSLSCMAL